MKKFCYILATLSILFLFGCSPTIIHKHYHYYPDGVSQCDTQASCHMKASKGHCGKKHGGKACLKHSIKKCAKHSADKPCPKMHGMQHGKAKHCDKHKGMKYGGMHHGVHDHSKMAEKPCGADCPCGCQAGQPCNCPHRNTEQLEELFNE